MEDGPEEAEGSYEYLGKVYRLAEIESERWSVFSGEKYQDVRVAVDGPAVEPWPHHSCVLAGDEASPGDATTDDWHAALELLADVFFGVDVVAGVAVFHLHSVQHVSNIAKCGVRLYCNVFEAVSFGIEPRELQLSRG
jgi:hypothetical protein